MKPFVLVIFLLVAPAAMFPCSPASQSNDSKIHPASKRGTGEIKGTIFIAGPVPKQRVIRMEGDQECARGQSKQRTESFVAHNGWLANVTVYLKDGAAIEHALFPAPPRDIRLKQRNCRFEPHVLALQTNQRLVISNDDATVHNVHPLPRINAEWNESQRPGGENLVRTFLKPELMIPVKCNQHPWMKAYVSVFSHPFFSVSDNTGEYSITGIPPGEYVIAAVHELLGESTAAVRVRAGAAVVQDFRFSPKVSASQTRKGVRLVLSGV